MKSVCTPLASINLNVARPTTEAKSFSTGFKALRDGIGKKAAKPMSLAFSSNLNVEPTNFPVTSSSTPEQFSNSSPKRLREPTAANTEPTRTEATVVKSQSATSLISLAEAQRRPEIFRRAMHLQAEEFQLPGPKQGSRIRRSTCATTTNLQATPQLPSADEMSASNSTGKQKIKADIRPRSRIVVNVGPRRRPEIRPQFPRIHTIGYQCALISLEEAKSRPEIWRRNLEDIK